MKKLPLLLWLAFAGALPAAFAQSHGHINAGAIDSNLSGGINAGDRLEMYFEHGTSTTMLAANYGTNAPGQDGFLFNGFTTFTALHQSSAPDEAPNYNAVGALSGSFLTLNLVSISGPAGAKFAFYDEDADVPAWIYQIGAELLEGDGVIALTEMSWFEGEPSDPFGHIHGRTFGVDLPGEYTVTWKLHDTQSGGTGLLDSSNFTATYLAIPEPATWLLACAGLLMLWKRISARVHGMARH